MLDEERQQMKDLPQMTVEEWNELYLEMTDELHAMIAKEMIQQRNQRPETAWKLEEAFSELLITNTEEALGPGNKGDVSNCPVCKMNIVRRV